jgi:hypothetical protein
MTQGPAERCPRGSDRQISIEGGAMVVAPMRQIVIPSPVQPMAGMFRTLESGSCRQMILPVGGVRKASRCS